MKKVFYLVFIVLCCFSVMVSCAQNNVNSYADDTSNNNNNLQVDNNVITSTDELNISQGNSQIDNSSNSNQNAIINKEFGDSANFKTTSINDDYYTMLEAGDYLGNDLPNEEGTYQKMIMSYEELIQLTEKGYLFDESIFDRGYVLVIKRVTGGHFADVGFKSHSYINHIQLDKYYSSSGNDGTKTKYDYLLIEESIEFWKNELYIDTFIKTYYASASKEHEAISDEKNAWLFLNAEDANEFLTENNVDLTVRYGDDMYVLVLQYNQSLSWYTPIKDSSILGFKNFHSDGNSVFITMERNIVNGNYGENSKSVVQYILIPKETVSCEITEPPNIFVLVQDNHLEVIYPEN